MPEPKDLLGDYSEPMPPFPGNFLQPAMEQFAAGIADRMQCPLDYAAIPLLIAAATVIGKQFRMAPKANDKSWNERPCLWGGVIGPVGSAKTPAMNTALAPFWKLREKLFEQDRAVIEAYKARERIAKLIDGAWKKACQSALGKGQELPERPKEADPGPAPITRQLVTSDTTQERLAQLIQTVWKQGCGGAGYQFAAMC